jgi:hypothetical protein
MSYYIIALNSMTNGIVVEHCMQPHIYLQLINF